MWFRKEINPSLPVISLLWGSADFTRCATIGDACAESGIVSYFTFRYIGILQHIPCFCAKYVIYFSRSRIRIGREDRNRRHDFVSAITNYKG